MADAQLPANGDEKGESAPEEAPKGRTGKRATPGGGEAVVATGPSSEDEPAQKKAVKAAKSEAERLTPAQYDTDGRDDVPAQMRG
jgi:hypothetical protein